MKAEKEKLILVTNDDGIEAKGLKTLVDILKPFGRILVVAPWQPSSGMSHAITVKYPLRLRVVENGEIHKYYSCSGTPVDCVKMALSVLLNNEKADLVVSGINHGSNASASVFYSGTMAAAMEGGIVGIPSIGFSLADYSLDADFSATGNYIRLIVENTIKHGLPSGVALNVNIPAVGQENIKGIKICRQTRGYWQEEFDKRTDPGQHDYYWLTGEFVNLEPDAEDTDEWALKNNYISIVPVPVDLTSYTGIEALKIWKF